MAVSSVGTRHIIFFGQMRANAHRHCFLTDILVHASRHGSLQKQPEEFLLELPDLHHLPVQTQGQPFFHRRCLSSVLFNRDQADRTSIESSHAQGQYEQRELSLSDLVQVGGGFDNGYLVVHQDLVTRLAGYAFLFYSRCV
jgi:hypothetical protein